MCERRWINSLDPRLSFIWERKLCATLCGGKIHQHNPVTPLQQQLKMIIAEHVEILKAKLKHHCLGAKPPTRNWSGQWFILRKNKVVPGCGMRAARLLAVQLQVSLCVILGYYFCLICMWSLAWTVDSLVLFAGIKEVGIIMKLVNFTACTFENLFHCLQIHNHYISYQLHWYFA